MDRLRSVIGQTDLYLLDGILKGYYPAETTLLDAGCGEGRNLHWFLQNGYAAWGIDSSPGAISQLQYMHPHAPPGRFLLAAVEELPFGNDFFGTVISSAVLHFARDEQHFFQMLSEMYRVLQVGGHLFIRMATDIGIESRVVPLGAGVFSLPDGSSRFLLTRSLLRSLLGRFLLSPVESFKTVNVNDVRSMCTLVLQKTGRQQRTEHI